jgi:hypothetical protein
MTPKLYPFLIGVLFLLLALRVATYLQKGDQDEYEYEDYGDPEGLVVC